MVEDSPLYDAGGGQIEMPRFISCKRIWALKIKAITEEQQNGQAGALLHFEDANYAPRFMQADWIDKRGAAEGGWLVAYSDGYLSWSPPNAFENGTVPERMWGLTRTQEPKYTIDLRGQIVKRKDQRAMPADEPLFILRAQDNCAIEALRAYRDALPPGSKARDSIDERLLAFSSFRTEHRDRMKDPDSDAPAPAAAAGVRWQPGEREREGH